jgi:hypothetical protein
VLQITPTQQDTPRWMGAFMSLHTWPYLMHVALLVALYVGTAKLGLSLHAVGGFATAVWPPTGLALVALVLGGYRLWPGIALGAYLVNVWAGAPLLVAAGRQCDHRGRLLPGDLGHGSRGWPLCEWDLSRKRPGAPDLYEHRRGDGLSLGGGGRRAQAGRTATGSP